MSANGEKVMNIFDRLSEIEYREFLQDVGCPYEQIEAEVSKYMQQRVTLSPSQAKE